MKIIIIGCGKVGRVLTGLLSAEKHDIIVIDPDQEVLDRLTDEFDVIGVKGNGASLTVQNEAEVGKADLMIAVSPEDEINIICCLLAKKLGVKHTIARIRNPEYAESLSFMKEELGLSMVINPERAAAREIMKIINFPSAISIIGLSKKKVELIEFRIMPGSTLAGQELHRFSERFGVKVLICVIERQTKVFIPKASDRLAENDKVYVTGNIRGLVTFSRLAGHSEHKVRSVMILGGGRISYYLAESIANADIKYKIIEKNRERCEQLCEALPGALIINGDGTEQRLLDEEDVSSADIFVALTDIDEENLFAAMFASKRGAKKVIAKINRTEYMSMIDDKIIDSVISPKLITAYQIVQYVRAMQNTIGSKVDTLFRIANERVEVLEFTVAGNTKNQSVPLKSIRFKGGLLIAAIIRAGVLAVPSGEAMFRKGDSVVVVTMDQSFADMNDIFAGAT